MFPDPLHLAIALGPLAVYFLLVGMINLSSRPLVTTGARDAAALGVGLSGLVFAGPMELFLPEDAAIHFGWVVWLLLLAFYGLCLTLIVLVMRPRLVIYNVTADQLRPLLAEVVNELDREARWAGESLVLPNLDVQLHIEPIGFFRNAELVASGPHQSFVGWKRLENVLATALKESRGEPNSYGIVPLLFGLLLIAVVTFMAVSNRQELTQALFDMLRI